jgi:hypothetical protein
MSLLKLGSGCDSCSTFDQPAIGMGQLNAMFDSQITGAMANPYTCQNNNMVSQQMQSFQATAGYPAGGAGAAGVPNMGQGSQYQPPTRAASQAAAQAAQAASNLVAATAAAAAAGAAAAQQGAVDAPQVPEDYSQIDVSKVHPASIEGFDMPTTLREHIMCVLVLFLVLVAALGMNEFSKFMINKSIQTADGSPFYYLLYCGLALLAGLIVVRYARNW